MVDNCHIVYQVLGLDNWESIAEIDNFLFVYDRLTMKERLIVNMRMIGYTNGEISRDIGISESTVRVHVHNAKKKFLNSIY